MQWYWWCCNRKLTLGNWNCKFIEISHRKEGAARVRMGTEAFCGGTTRLHRKGAAEGLQAGFPVLLAGSRRHEAKDDGWEISSRRNMWSWLLRHMDIHTYQKDSASPRKSHLSLLTVSQQQRRSILRGKGWTLMIVWVNWQSNFFRNYSQPQLQETPSKRINPGSLDFQPSEPRGKLCHHKKRTFTVVKQLYASFEYAEYTRWKEMIFNFYSVSFHYLAFFFTHSSDKIYSFWSHIFFWEFSISFVISLFYI